VLADETISEAAVYKNGSALEPAEQYGAFLRSATSLKHFAIGYYQCDGDNDTCGDNAWLSSILSNQSWPQLCKFTLNDFLVNADDMISFLACHSTTLIEVTFHTVTIQDDYEVHELVKYMRERLSLNDVRSYNAITCTDHICLELEDIFSTWLPRGGPCPDCVGKVKLEAEVDPYDPYDPNDLNESESCVECCFRILESYILKEDPESLS
jgi:hypothetical protein